MLRRIIICICFICCKERKMKKKIFWSVCAAAMMSVFAVRAQNTECCQKIPTCAEMGYNLSAPKGHGWFCTARPIPRNFPARRSPVLKGLQVRKMQWAHTAIHLPDDNIRSIVPARVTVGIKFVERRHLFLYLLVTLFLHPTRHL